MSAKHAHTTLMISPSLIPNEKPGGECTTSERHLRVDTSLVTSHTDPPKEPVLESCYIKKTSYGVGGVKEAMSRRPRISLYII